jgi:hypothetical protein
LQAATDRAAFVAAPHQHQPPPPTTRRSPQGAAPRHGEGGQRRHRTAAPRHTAGCGPRPRRGPPCSRSPTRHVPSQQQQVGGKEDILSSSTGPSTARCSKDVTTHQHRPGARSKQPFMVASTLGVYSLGLIFISAKSTKAIIIIIRPDPVLLHGQGQPGIWICFPNEYQQTTTEVGHPREGTRQSI